MQHEKLLLHSRRIAANRLGVSIRTIDGLLASGQLRCVRILKRVLIPESEILRVARHGATAHERAPDLSGPRMVTPEKPLEGEC